MLFALAASSSACRDRDAGPPGHRPLDDSAAARLRESTRSAPPRADHPIGATFGAGALELVGLDATPSPLVPGASATLTWWWRCGRPTPHDVRMFVHAEDAAQGARAQGDHDLVEGLLASSHCTPGKVYEDRHLLDVPVQAEALTLWVGLHRWTDRLPPDPGAVDDGRGRLRGPTLAVAEPADLPSLRVPRAQRAPNADGRVEAAEWRDALRVTLLDSGSGRSPVEATTAFLLWDERALYVAFEVRDEDVGAVSGGRDAPVWEDDAVELFLATGAASGYVELDVSPAGALFDASLTGARRGLDPGFDSAADVGASVDGSLRAPETVDRGFTVELSVPWERLPGRPLPVAGFPLRANLFRLDRDAGRAPVGQALSPPLVADFHVPRRFARLELAP